MRSSSRRRAAAWLLALPLGRGGEECARRGRLEMISFWLLCWKLLRATAGLRRTTLELADGNHDDDDDASNNPVNDPRTPPAEPVTMEISSSPPLTDLERDNFFSYQIQDQPDVQGAGKEAAGGEYGKGDECDYLVFEIGGEKGAERGGESEGREAAAAADEGRGEIEGQDEGRGEIDGEEEWRGETEGEDEGRREVQMKDEDRGRVEGGDGKRGATKTEDLGKREIEGEDGGRGSTSEGWIEGRVTEERDDTPLDLLFDSDSLMCGHSMEAAAAASSSLPPGAALPEPWGHDLLGLDDLGSCLQAELAMVYSDSEAGEEPWLENLNGMVGRDEEEPETEERREREDGVDVEMTTTEQKEQEEEEVEEERRGGREEDEEQRRGRDAFPRSPSVSSTASSTDPDRKFPVDFCVHQEMRSENVSTEHVDFMLARKQWKKMEAEVKGHPIPKPGLRAQGSFQGTHSSLYPPTRSPRLKHREVQPPVGREPPLSSTLSPTSEDSGLDDPSYRSPPEDPETAVEREIRLTLEREEQHRRERGRIAQGLNIPRPSSLQTGRSPPRPPACRTPTLSISPSPSHSSSLPRSMYHELTANNVIILEPDSSGAASRNRLLSTAISGLSDWPANQDTPPANVIVVETSNLIIRSASEFCLSSGPGLAPAPASQESTFTSNPFFKLRSLSSQSLVEQEIRMVRQREEEWRRQREDMWRRRKEEQGRRGKERYDTVLVSPGLSDNISFTVPEVPDRCVSSPSSPSRTRKMERSSLSCDHKWFS